MYIYIFDLQFSILQWLTERMMCEPASRACDQSAAWHQMPVSAQAGLKTWHENEKARLLSSLHIHWAHPTVHRTYHVFGKKFATSWVCSHFLHWCTAACWSEIMQHTAHTLTEIYWAFHCAGVLPWHGVHHISQGRADGWYAMIKFVNQFVTKLISDPASNNVTLDRNRSCLRTGTQCLSVAPYPSKTYFAPLRAL